MWDVNSETLRVSIFFFFFLVRIIEIRELTVTIDLYRVLLKKNNFYKHMFLKFFIFCFQTFQFFSGHPIHNESNPSFSCFASAIRMNTRTIEMIKMTDF